MVKKPEEIIEDTITDINNLIKKLVNQLQINYTKKMKDELDELKEIKRAFKLKWRNYFDNIKEKRQKDNIKKIIFDPAKNMSGIDELGDIIKKYFHTKDSGFYNVLSYYSSHYLRMPADYDNIANLLNYLEESHVLPGSLTPLSKRDIVNKIVDEVNNLPLDTKSDLGKNKWNDWDKFFNNKNKKK